MKSKLSWWCWDVWERVWGLVMMGTWKQVNRRTSGLLDCPAQRQLRNLMICLACRWLCQRDPSVPPDESLELQTEARLAHCLERDRSVEEDDEWELNRKAKLALAIGIPLFRNPLHRDISIPERPRNPDQKEHICS